MNFGDFFIPQKSLKMRDVLEKMRECGKLPNLRDFPHDCGMVDTYEALSMFEAPRAILPHVLCRVKLTRMRHSLGVSVAKNIISNAAYLHQVAYVIHYNLWMILPFHVQPSISCRYDDKGTFYNTFRLNALSCKKESPSPEFVSRRDAAGSRPREEEEEEEEEEERLLWQINNNTMLYMISFATETPIKTCNMSLAWEPPYNIMI